MPRHGLGRGRAGVARKLNRVISRSFLSTRFVSLVYGELERNGTFVYINAGHPPPLLIKKDGVVELTVGGTILGPMEDAVYKRGFAFLDPGDVLVLFTDGIVERADRKGELFGKARLMELMRGVRNEPSDVIVEELFASLLLFGNGDKWRDDVTVVVVKRLE